MDRVRSIADRPLDHTNHIAVLIGQPKAPQSHIGIVHTSKESGMALLHLAWHCQLRNDSTIPPDLKMKVWVAPPVPKERLRSMAAFCRRLWKKSEAGEVPYAFSHPSGAFDSNTGALLLGPTRFGLTCASFVLAVFEATGLKLVDYTSWPVDRPGDREWQESMVALLATKQAPEEHVDHVRSEIGAARYRPEEVAAAAAIAPPSTTFAAIDSLSVEILAKLI